jgi:integrase
MHPNRTPLRERVERGIYKRKTKDGVTRYELAYLDSDGRQRWRTVSSLREARTLRAELVSKVARGDRVAPVRIPFAEFADAWLVKQQARLRPKTFELYDSYLRLHLKPRLGRRQLQAITVDDVASLIGEMQRGIRYAERGGHFERTEGKPFAGWTIRGVLVVLGRVLASAARDGLITSNPVRRLEKGERPAVRRRPFPSLDKAAVGRLIQSAPEKYRALIALSVLTGVRQSEALALLWRDVAVQAGVVRICRQLDRQGNLVEPKTLAAVREIPIPPSLGRMLTAEKERAFARGLAGRDDFVFASETGTPLGHRNIVRRGLNKALETAELPNLTWHDLRHVAASILIAEGASVAYVSRVLGHANPSITLSIYAHEFARAEHADRTRERMEQAFGDLLS